MPIWRNGLAKYRTKPPLRSRVTKGGNKAADEGKTNEFYIVEVGMSGGQRRKKDRATRRANGTKMGREQEQKRKA